ncbi:MAG: BMP family ABC transporter substrate-binding protein [Treponema sp.]|nr:BMP family ABC transporter substrate-binding protein [Treponema sp.]
MRKYFILLIASFCLFEGCSVFSRKPSDLNINNLKAGFIYPGSVDDEGSTQSHDNGRKALSGMGIQTAYSENINEGDYAACEKAIRTLIKKEKCNVIFATNSGYSETTKYMAKRFPKVYFFQCGSNISNHSNLCSYSGKDYQTRYLAGIVAGLKTKTNRIGYVAAYAIPECIRGINAFTLGAQSVNPDVTVNVMWTSTWFDPSIEKHAALLLLDKDCDIITCHQNSTAIQIAAQEKNAFCIGYNLPTPAAAPLAYLTASIFNWDVFYKNAVLQILDKKWKPSFYWCDLNSGVVDLDELSSLCAPSTKDYIEDYKTRMKKGLFEPFTGPIWDQYGLKLISEKQELTEEEIWNMNWFVKGVDSSNAKTF